MMPYDPSRPYAVEELAQCKSAAFFFSSGWGGTQPQATRFNTPTVDAGFAHSQGMNDVTLIDKQKGKLNDSKNFYGPQWNYIHGDAFKEARRFLDEGKSFDFVSCDPWSGMQSRTYKDNFLDFYNITNKYLVNMTTQDYWSGKNSPANSSVHDDGTPPSEAVVEDKAQLSLSLSSYHNLDIHVSSVIRRGSGYGGIYWVVIKK